MTEQSEEELYRKAQCAYDAAMREWQMAQDDAITHLIEKCKELDAEVKRLSSMTAWLWKGENEVA